MGRGQAGDVAGMGKWRQPGRQRPPPLFSARCDPGSGRRPALATWLLTWSQAWVRTGVTAQPEAERSPAPASCWAPAGAGLAPLAAGRGFSARPCALD